MCVCVCEKKKKREVGRRYRRDGEKERGRDVREERDRVRERSCQHLVTDNKLRERWWGRERERECVCV